jgi:glycosyltransferase involved in cell wall biosynthesis
VSIEDELVALDVAPVRAQPAGVGLYVANLARELTKAAPAAVGLIGVRADSRALAGLAGRVARRPFRGPIYHSWLQISAEGDARAIGASLIHFTNAAAPLIGRLPYVLTVHDLSLARMPASHPYLRWWIAPINLAALARARRVIVPSRWTATELRRLGVSPVRIDVIPHAPTMTPATDGGALIAALETRFGIAAGRYVLYFGTLEPRKNIVRLVAAFERLAATDRGLALVLVGAPGWRYSGIGRRIAASPARERIVLTGYLPEVELAALVSHSAAVAYVSLYEGFGMPVLDALALGAAVVTSNRTAMPEAAGGAAILVDPTSVEAIAAGLSNAIERRDELAAAGRARAALRSWADVAAEHRAAYDLALRG